jgi:pimeloyl-ACP methyl ester carboxylesterase
MTRSTIGGLTLAGLVLATSACGGVSTPSAPAATSAPTTAPTSLAFDNADVAVGGRTLHLVCAGPTTSKQPTVLFEAGLGDDSRMWVYEMSQVALATRTCAYDRAGTGESGAAPGPRTTADQVADLDSLLTAAGITGPLVLVGWSLGGWNAMVYTDRHPERVAGVVLVDVRPPGASTRWLAELPAETPSESDALRGNREEFTTFELDPSLNPERLDLRKSSAQAAAARFGGQPVTFLWAMNTAELWEGLDPDLAARLDGVLLDLRSELQSKAPDSTATVVDASHNIPDDAPQSVVAAVRAMLLPRS